MAPSRINNLFHRTMSRALSVPYRAWSPVFSGTMQARIKEAVLVKKAEIQAEAVNKFLDRISYALKKATGVRISNIDIRTKIDQGIKYGFIEQHGTLLFIRPSRIKFLAAAFELSNPHQVSAFTQTCQKTGIVFLRHQRRKPGESYELETRDGPYSYVPFETLTDDGKKIGIRRLINTEVSEVQEDNPDIIVIPGLFMQSSLYDLRNFNSPARFLADQGYRVFLMDHRGHGQSFNSWDPNATFDTHTRYDVPAVIDAVNMLSKGRRPLLYGYSMGGMEAVNLPAYRGAKVEEDLLELSRALEPLSPRTVRINEKLSSFRSKIESSTANYLTVRSFENANKIRTLINEIRDYLSATLKKIDSLRQLSQDNKDEIELKINRIIDIIDDITYGFDELSKIRGIISTGAPKSFDKYSHAALSLLLYLNYIVPMIGLEDVPLHRVAWVVDTFLPNRFVDGIFNLNPLGINPLIIPNNHKQQPDFLRHALVEGTGRIPLPLGLQFLMAIFSGKDFKSIDGQDFRYPAHLESIPRDIPIAEIYGEGDIFAPPKLHMPYVQRYSHARKIVFPLLVSAGKQIRIPHTSLTDTVLFYALAECAHLDFLNGHVSKYVYLPLVKQLVEGMAA